MMLSSKGYKAFCQADEADAKSTLIDDTLDGICRSQLVGANPETLHHQRELLGISRLLELEAVVELFGCHFKYVVKFGEEHADALLLVFLAHALDGELYYVYGGERKVSASDGSLRTKAVLKDTCTASHCCHFVQVSLWIISFPFVSLVERCVKIQEIRKETACSHLAGKCVEVEVAISRQVVDATFLFQICMGKMAVSPPPTPS